MMVLTEEFKRELMAEIKHDAAFGFDLYYALLGSVNGDALHKKRILTKALAKQSGILTPNSSGKRRNF